LKLKEAYPQPLPQRRGFEFPFFGKGAGEGWVYVGFVKGNGNSNSQKNIRLLIEI